MAAKLTPEIVAEAQALRAKGMGVREIADRLGVGKTQLAAAMSALAMPSPALVQVQKGKAKPAAQRPAQAAAAPLPSPPPVPPVGIDATGTPLDIARAMLGSLTTGMAGLEKDSPAYVRLSAEARQCAKLIAALEREAAGEETPEELERRRRREDAETRREIERYVDQALALALRPSPEAPHGRCPTCSSPLSAEGRTALTGA